MRRTLVMLCALALVGCGRSAVRHCPTLSDYDPARMAECANEFIMMGEDAAYRRLRHIASGGRRDGPPDHEYRRVSLLCRMLYSSRTEIPLREPTLGRPYFPSRAVSPNDWPRLPLVLSDGVVFLVARRHKFMGPPPSTLDYLEYCRENGIFRAKPYQVPSAEEAQDALAALVESDRWRAIPWRGAIGEKPYEFDPHFVLMGLYRQIERIGKTDARTDE